MFYVWSGLSSCLAVFLALSIQYDKVLHVTRFLYLAHLQCVLGGDKVT